MTHDLLRRVAYVCLFFTLAIASTDTALAAGVKPLSDIVKVGTTCRYLEEAKMKPQSFRFTIQVVHVGQDQFTMSLCGEGGKCQMFRYTPYGPDFRVSGSGEKRQWDSFFPRFFFGGMELVPGQEWSYQYPYEGTELVKGENVMMTSVRVRGWEEMTVPAGTFRALRITEEKRYNETHVIYGPRRGKGIHEYWYDLQSGCMVKVAQEIRGWSDSLVADMVRELVR